ncbi:uncharacterized protein LOC121736445 [Aricia agestis]|uniref:uncharacterized protein LOC121736445 n=1 Tax=Aricia agestis TaxID=91739 RepID=UPI001C20290F|nr:uncharacterized protein LOC121736445 [Aricia agestis]
MGLSRDSDNGKSNKVTQCPKLKVFKMMEQKDLDPEKIRLLKQKQKEKKKKYSESRSKIAQDLYESSSTERFQQPKRKSSTAVQDKERFDYGRQDVFEDRQDKLKESPSRVSCALKKLLGSEYACAGCFALIFLVTIVAGLLLVFKVMSSTSDMTGDDSVKVHSAKGKRQSDDYDIFGGRRYRRKILDDGYQFPIYSAATDKNEFGYTSDLSEQSSYDDITNIMNGAEIMDSDNEKLRDFYKKLIETDAEIKRVKQNLQINIRKYDKQELERIKRSLKKTQSGPMKQRHQGNKRLNIRSNRQSNSTDDGYGIVIQEQEVIVYGPKKSGKNNHRKFYKKHYKHSVCNHKQKIARQNNMSKNNFKILKEEKNHFNNTEIITTKYDRDNIVNAVQKDVDMIYLPSFESLHILSNIT